MTDTARDAIPEYVPVAEAARRLGCSRDTVYAAIRAGAMPALKLTPNCIRIPRAAFERYVRGDWSTPVTNVTTIDGRKRTA